MKLSSRKQIASLADLPMTSMIDVVFLLLIFFIAGAVIGAMAMVPMIYRHRRDLTHHRKTLAEVEKERDAAQQAATQAPQPDSVRNT